MKKQVQPDTVDWAWVDHYLQVVTGKSSVKVINIYKFDDSNHETIKKDNKSWIDATINITDFSNEFYRNVVEKTVPLEDLIVCTGHVNIHKFNSQPYKIFKFLICKVFLGIAANLQTPMRKNCDSIVVPPESGETYQYNFYLKQYYQYQVKYQASFTVSEDKDFKISQFSCCNCENRSPTIYCSTQKLNFCEDCCNDHHKTKLMQSHALEHIDKINTLQNCKTHNQKFQLYCLKCEKYLCGQCIQKGIHAQGTDHVIKSIRYFYEELTQNIQNLPKKSLEKIEVLSYNLKVKRKQIQQNEREVREQIQIQYKKSIQMLEQEISKKYQLLDSIQLQLIMLKDKISWNQSFCVFQSNALKPIHFFKSQVIFQNEIKKIKVADFDTMLICKPDIIYRGFNIVGLRQIVQRHKDYRKFADPTFTLKKIEQNEQNPKLQQQIVKSTLFSFDPSALPPNKDELCFDLSTCGFKFFQLRAK